MLDIPYEYNTFPKQYLMIKGDWILVFSHLCICRPYHNGERAAAETTIYSIEFFCSIHIWPMSTNDTIRRNRLYFTVLVSTCMVYTYIHKGECDRCTVYEYTTCTTHVYVSALTTYMRQMAGRAVGES